MTRVKWNAFANLAGMASATVLGIVLVPIYLRYLGIESYGLIGIFTVMQTALVLFDLGVGLTVTRGMARLSLQPDGPVKQGDLLRTAEFVYWPVAIAIGAGTYLAAGSLARNWIHSSGLPEDVVIVSVRWMAVALALQFPVALYRASLLGLDRHVLMNTMIAALAIFRAAGAVVVLTVVSRTVIAYFEWQVVATMITTLLFATVTWRVLHAPHRARFRSALLQQEWRYSAKVSANTVLHMFVSHVDKVILSALLPLAAFGYYNLAATLATAPWMITVPVNTTLFPRFTQLFEHGRTDELAGVYHAAAQAMAVLVLPGAALLICFSHPILELWTRSQPTADNAAPLVTFLVCGATLTSLASIAGYMAAAGGRPQVMTQTNIAAAICIVPLMTFAASRFGARGAALVWIGISLFHLFGAVPLAHRLLLPGEMSRWYVDDLLKPLLAVAAVMIPARLLLPQHGSAGPMLAQLAGLFALSTIAAVLAAPQMRAYVKRVLPRPR